jgi:hypothetical protein
MKPVSILLQVSSEKKMSRVEEREWRRRKRKRNWRNNGEGEWREKREKSGVGPEKVRWKIDDK